MKQNFRILLLFIVQEYCLPDPITTVHVTFFRINRSLRAKNVEISELQRYNCSMKCALQAYTMSFCYGFYFDEALECVAYNKNTRPKVDPFFEMRYFNTKNFSNRCRRYKDNSQVVKLAKNLGRGVKLDESIPNRVIGVSSLIRPADCFQKVCPTLGMRPVTIHSEEENKQLNVTAKAFHNSDWAILYATIGFRGIEWQDGSAMNYSNTNPTLCYIADNEGSCIGMATGSYAGTWCTLKCHKKFLCACTTGGIVAVPFPG